MSRHGRDFDRAQRAYDAQTPYDNEPKMVECPKCDGDGWVETNPTSDAQEECDNCKGSGEIPKPPKEEREWDEGSDR